jgi:hypothetical protein
MEWDYALPYQTYAQIVMSMHFGTLFTQLNELWSLLFETYLMEPLIL